MTIYILLILAAVGTGMAISVYAFGTGGKRKRIFQDIYFSVEDNKGVGVVYTKTESMRLSCAWRTRWTNTPLT